MQTYRFFGGEGEPLTLVQDGSNETKYASQPFDSTAMTSITVEARVYGLVGTTPQIDIMVEVAGSVNATDEQWSSPLTAMSFNGTGQDTRVLATGPTPPLGAIRVTVTFPASGQDAVGTLRVLGFGRTG
jgi:hypothetical protein